jgi:hypothetical protein
MDNQYEELRKILIAILKDLEQIKKKSKSAIQCAKSIGGPIEKEMSSLIKEFDKLALQCLKIEQEAREI